MHCDLQGTTRQQRWDDSKNDDDEDNYIAWADRDCMATARDEEDDNDGTMTTTRTTITRKVDIF